MPKLKKTNDPIPRKQPDRQQDGGVERTLPASAGGPTNKTAVDWHLKVKQYAKNQLSSYTHS